MRRSRILLSGFALAFVHFACGASATSEPPAAPVTSSGSAVDAWFPLEDGRIYAYETHDGSESGMLVAKVRRADATHGELRLSNATKRFVYERDGVRYDETGVYVLKAPIAVGTVSGHFAGLGEDGSLLLATADGAVHAMVAGEVEAG